MPPFGLSCLCVLFYLLSLAHISHQTPVITYITGEQIKDIEDTVELNCTIENVENFSIAWSKRNRDHPADSVILAIKNSLSLNDPRYKLSEEKEGDVITYSLEISKVQAADMGIYECQVITSASDKVTASVELLVKHPPVIIEALTTKVFTIPEGQSAKLSCAATGYPRPSISWKREYNAIMPGGGHIYNGGVVDIKSTHRADRGTYYCVADNGVGKPHEKVVSLEIEFAPKIRAPRPKVAQAKNYAVELECKVEAYPAPAVFWYKDGVQMSSTDSYRITHIATAFEVTNSVLRIPSVAKRDYGDYFCNATNKMGRAEARINLFEPNLPVLAYNNEASKYD